MKHRYSVSPSVLKSLALMCLLVFGSAQVARACHGMPLLNLTGVPGPTRIAIGADSDPSTCGCGPYWMQVEVTCNPAGFTGAPPVSSSSAWGTVPWYHSNLNIPNYNAASGWPDNCVQEPYDSIHIPFAQLCPGTVYYWRAREWVEGDNSAGSWSSTFSFTTPGSPPASVLVATATQYMVCPGSQVQLNSSVSGGCPGATYNFQWSPTTGLSNPNIANPIATVTGPITYTVSVSGGCFTITTSDDTVGIVMGPSPNPGTATATPTSVCSGQFSQVVLGGYASNTNIQWEVSPNGVTWFNLSGATNDTLNAGPLTSTLYYHALVTGSGYPGSGCGTTPSNPVMITVNPAPVADAGLNQTVCNGSCANLTGTGGVSYSWQPNNLSGANISVCPTTNTTYTLTVTDANGCTATDNVTVNISTATVTASPDVSICNGNSTILLASGSSGNTYNWTPNSFITGANTANPSVNPPSTTTYVVTATNGFGCTAADSVVVTVTAAPPITLSNDTTLCAGGTVNLTATGATSYSWQPGNQSGPTISVTPGSTTTYTVTGNNGNCVSVDSVTVSINPPPAVFAGPDFSICNGTHGTLNVATSGTSYSWAPTSSILGSPSTQSVIIDPTTATSYTVTVVGPGGCISTDTINVGVNPTPTVTATATDNSICPGQTTTLTGSGATNFAWIPTVGVLNPNLASTGANPTTTTTYQVVGTDANGCMDTASITITVNPPPAVYITSTPTECGDTTGTMVNSGVVSGTGPFTYTIGSQTYNNTLPTGLQAGQYTVVTTDANGCSSTQVVTVGMVNNSNVSAAASPTFGVYPLAVSFGASGTSGLTNWNWQFGDFSNSANTQSASHTYTQPGTYTVVVTAWNDWFGCAVTDTITITVVEQATITLPNVFTPNSDGTNDGFIANISGVKDIDVEIYNRWGGRVYEGEQSGLSSGPQMVTIWDGKDAVDGVYYYVVKAIGYDGNTYPLTGFVHVIKGK